MMYVRQIETLLDCDCDIAMAVFELMFDLDLSECTDRQFNRAARIAYAELQSQYDKFVTPPGNDIAKRK